ncbi:hypothetical protein [Amycolatopsis sp. NPDC001319]|uniref:hypothetical protein n=1 Tax=unclassified Amycolatopsis TaxID=2618356 RepID=UPI00369C27AF
MNYFSLGFGFSVCFDLGNVRFGLTEIRGVHTEVVAATVHIVRLGFGRSRGAGGVGVGSSAELAGNVPESAWRPHGSNPPRGHPVVSPMVAYVV